MHTSPRHSRQKEHTVVLGSRQVSAQRPLIIGSNKGYISTARGSPPKPPPRTLHMSLLAPPSRGTQLQKRQEYPEPRGSDLLVRFGIDTHLGIVVGRILVCLLLFQPVYVAMGMELDEQPQVQQKEEQVLPEEVPDVQESVEESNVVEEDIEEPEGERVDGESEFSEETEVDSEFLDGEEESAEVGADELVDVDEGESVGVEEGVEVGEVVEDIESDGEEEVVEDVEEEEVSEETASGGGSSAGSHDEDVEEETEDGVEEVSNTEPEEEYEDEEVIEEEDVERGATEREGGTDGSSDVDDATLTDGSTEEGEEQVEGEVVDELTEEVVTEQVTIAQNAENKYIFSEGDCTLVSEGEFYCVSEGIDTQVTGDPRVYAEKDREGDREINYFDGVEVHRITNNSYDDFAPVFDDETLRIVWQAMINDRLQVMLYDIPTNTTRQVTTSRNNSSNPTLSGDTVVWQEWVDTNWEIMLTEVSDVGQPFEIEQLTDNAVHDMFPVAYDDLVTWQSERGASWEVVVYDMHTGKQHTVKKDEDTKYENPRFVLLFDSKHENGDAETIGYDLDTGEMMELGTKAAPIPVNPVTPKEETPDALPQESTSTTQVKVSSRDDDVPDNTL